MPPQTRALHGPIFTLGGPPEPDQNFYGETRARPGPGNNLRYPPGPARHPFTLGPSAARGRLETGPNPARDRKIMFFRVDTPENNSLHVTCTPPESPSPARARVEKPEPGQGPVQKAHAVPKPGPSP